MSRPGSSKVDRIEQTIVMFGFSASELFQISEEICTMLRLLARIILISRRAKDPKWSKIPEDVRLFNLPYFCAALIYVDFGGFGDSSSRDCSSLTFYFCEFEGAAVKLAFWLASLAVWSGALPRCGQDSLQLFRWCSLHLHETLPFFFVSVRNIYFSEVKKSFLAAVNSDFRYGCEWKTTRAGLHKTFEGPLSPWRAVKKNGLLL